MHWKHLSKHSQMHWYLRFKILLSDTKNITFLVNTNHKNVSHIYYTTTHICGKNNTFLRRISCLIFSLFPKCLCPCDLSIDSVHFRFMSEKKAILAYNKDFDRKTEQKRMSL